MNSHSLTHSLIANFGTPSKDVSELRTQETNKTVGHFSPKPFCLLGRLHQGLQSHPSLAKYLALLVQGDRLLHARPDPEKLTHFIEVPYRSAMPM